MTLDYSGKFCVCDQLKSHASINLPCRAWKKYIRVTLSFHFARVLLNIQNGSCFTFKHLLNSLPNLLRPHADYRWEIISCLAINEPQKLIRQSKFSELKMQLQNLSSLFRILRKRCFSMRFFTFLIFLENNNSNKSRCKNKTYSGLITAFTLSVLSVCFQAKCPRYFSSV